MRRRLRLSLAYAVACLAPAALGCSAAWAGSGQVGERVPGYEARVLDGGAAASLADLRGRAVLVNKWSTWCRPCVQEMPALERLQQRYGKRGLLVVGVSIDHGGDGKVRDVARERGVTYPIWRDEEDLFTSTFRSTGVPESVLVDRRGLVVYRWRGEISDEPATGRTIERALAARGGYAAIAAEDVRRLGIVALLIALAAGLLSFLSPCVLPLMPSYAAFIIGLSARPAGGAGAAAPGRGALVVETAAPPGPGAQAPAEVTNRASALAHGSMFVAGFTTIFVLLGASATSVGGALREYSDVISIVGGVMLAVLGLHLVGLLRIPAFDRDVRLLERARSSRRLGPATAYVVGGALAAGWTPCIGPVLAGILTLAATRDTIGEGMLLLFAYSMGLAIPFLAATVALDRFLLGSQRLKRIMPWTNRISGVLLLVLAVLLITGSMTWLSDLFGDFLPTEDLL